MSLSFEQFCLCKKFYVKKKFCSTKFHLNLFNLQFIKRRSVWSGNIASIVVRRAKTFLNRSNFEQAR